MQELRLTQPVTVTGSNFFGWPSHITFSPVPSTVPQHLHDSWLWRPNGEAHHPIPIDPSVVEYRKRRLRLANVHSYLEVIEHIAPLRWLGINGLVLEGHGWTPYHGRPHEYFDALQSHLCPSGSQVQWYLPQREIYYKHQDEMGGYSLFIPQDPTLAPNLNLKVTVRYPVVGKITVHRSLPSQHLLLRNDFRAYTQGLPHWLYYLSAIGQHFPLWKHHGHVNWYLKETPSPKHMEATLDAFASHRITDLLGALALVHPSRLLAGTVISVFGGHQDDLAFIKKLLPQAPLLC